MRSMSAIAPRRRTVRRAIFFSAIFSLCAGGMVSAQDGAAGPIAAALRPFVESGEMPGFVTIVATPDAVLDTTVIGWADVEAKVPMREDSVFWIASMTKTVAAVATMALVDDGKISLDDPIDRYYPELGQLRVAVPQENGDVLLVPTTTRPTIRQVLSHTAGLIFITPLMERFGIDSLPLERKMVDIARTPLTAQPGTKFQYSNIGIDIAAAIVEKVSGQKFEDFCQERIFTPLGMTSTTWYPTPAQQKEMAVSYTWDAEKKTLKAIPIRQRILPLDDRMGRFADGGGGLFSTAGDMLKFYRMLLGRGETGGVRVISEAAIGELSRKQTGDALGDMYGLGTFVGGDGSFGHSGAYATDGRAFPDRGALIVFMVQVTGVPKQGDAKAAFDRAADALAPVRRP